MGSKFDALLRKGYSLLVGAYLLESEVPVECSSRNGSKGAKLLDFSTHLCFTRFSRSSWNFCYWMCFRRNVNTLCSYSKPWLRCCIFRELAWGRTTRYDILGLSFDEALHCIGAVYLPMLQSGWRWIIRIMLMTSTCRWFHDPDSSKNPLGFVGEICC